MPSLVAFGRRWQIGSDDLVVPGLQLALGHLIQAILLGLFLRVVEWKSASTCELLLWMYVTGYLGVFAASIAVEFAICFMATRGSIFDTVLRAPIRCLLYIKLGLILIEVLSLCAGIIWIVCYYDICDINHAMKQAMLGFVMCNWILILVVMLVIWCIYDPAGRTWVKMTKYRKDYERSARTDRDWRHGKVMNAYHDRWTQRCSVLFCCAGECDTDRDSFTDIARLLNDIFLHLDVVPSDVVAGLVLLREFQMIERKLIVQQRENDTYEFLSGVPITPRTKFLSQNDATDAVYFENIIHYMHFALAAYGGPSLLLNHVTGPCKQQSRCCLFPRFYNNNNNEDIILEEDACECNYSVFHNLVQTGAVDIAYTAFVVDVGKTPFFVALDYTRKQVVISIRGTMSMVDILTDLDGEPVVLPLTDRKEDWLAHKMMLQAAEYIRIKLIEDNVLAKAFNKDPAKGTDEFGLTLVGHSLGAGTASILAILLRQEYPNLVCFSYAPPGGLLSMPAQIYTQEFIISIIVGKDFVPRMGLRQMECLRADVMNAMKESVDPKWKTICSVMCCGCNSKPTAVIDLENRGCIVEYHKKKDQARLFVPIDTVIIKPQHIPLYPPGKIIHVVRKHLNEDDDDVKERKRCKPLFQALWAGPEDYDEVLISPAMIQDHRPDHMLAILNEFKVTSSSSS